VFLSPKAIMQSGLACCIALSACTKPRARVFDNPIDPEVVAAKEREAAAEAEAAAAKEKAASSSSTSTGDTTTTTENDGIGEVEIKTLKSYSSSLPSTEDGTNKIVSMVYDSTASQFLLLKDMVKRFSDNLEYRPLLKIPWTAGQMPDTYSSTQINIDDWVPANVHRFGSSYYSSGNFSESASTYSEWYIVTYNQQGVPQNNVRVDLDGNVSTQDRKDMHFYIFSDGSSSLKAIATRYSTKLVQSMCTLDLNGSSIIESCENAPDSNPSYAATASNAAKGFAVLSNKLYLMALASTGNYEIQQFDMKYTYSTRYSFGSLTIPKKEMDSGLLTTDGQELYFVSLDGNTLNVRQLKLVD